VTRRTAFRLKVKQIHQSCSFELSWGEGQELFAQLDYPASLTTKYQAWQSAYVDGYKNLQRGRVVKNIGINLPPEYWHSRLVKAESELLYEFHQWLRNAALFEIRTKIAGATKEHNQVDVFLTCDSLELTRLPWETWEIGAESVVPGTIRIARTPSSIRHEPPQPRRGRARILVIVGYDEQLDFKKDRQAVERILNGAAEVKFIGLQPGQEPAKLKTQICEAIADERGWDMLFFIGHSNEAHLMGGELGIAPGVFLSIKEIEQPLTEAKKRGLQFAVFNSCSGLDIAKSLISIGLSQVAVMREPIHNQVAQEFLVRFLQVLAEYRDVHDALLEACQYLKLEKHFTYPSAYLIPSLFCHPDAELFRLKPSGFWQGFKRWQPTRGEAIALSTLLLLSLMVPVQDLLLDAQTGVQAIYRHLTNQSGNIALPPVLLIAIDQESINRANETITGFQTMPIDREYLAQLVSHLSNLKAKTIGIDYLLHTQEPKQQKLADSIQIAVTQQGTWFVFAVSENDKWKVLDKIASSKWSLQGDINIFPWDVRLPVDDPTCSSSKLCPFAYLLALSYKLNQNRSWTGVPQPQWQSKGDFQQKVSQYLNQGNRENNMIPSLKRVYPPFGRFIIDFSIPPDQAYERIPAWEFLRLPLSPEFTQRLKQQVVIVASGGYTDAEDNFSVPLAIQYWCYSQKWKQGKKVDCPQEFTGGEAHAYIVHHLLSQHRILLIPDFWMVGIAALLGRWANVKLLKQKRQQQKRLVWIWLGATGVYGGIGLQVYVTASISIPWFFPSVMFWIYVLSVFKRIA
jgi:hypothetical protein